MMNRRDFLTSIAGVGTLRHLPVAGEGDIRPEALRAGDVLVLELHEGEYMDERLFEEFRSSMKKLFPNNECIVVESGSLKGFRPE